MTEAQAKDALAAYEPALVAQYQDLMRQKLGLVEWRSEDGDLLTSLLEIMQADHVDYTNAFRALGAVHADPARAHESLRDLFLDRTAFDVWAGRYQERLRAEGSCDAERVLRMNRVNPKYVLRNYLVQGAIAQATEKRDFTEITRLLELLRDPFAERPDMEPYAALPPDWGKRLVVSCSS
jgi:hypothetical protein